MKLPGKLLKYSASAGSGKTHALTAFYLSQVLHDPGAYRRILAVTFTNSAAAEMKERILRRLNTTGLENEKGDRERKEFAVCSANSFLKCGPTGRLLWLQCRNAPVALDNILQDYSRFAVGTIDSFFQRVIRAFARKLTFRQAMRSNWSTRRYSLMPWTASAEVATDGKLLDWISSYVASRLDDSKGWDIRREIMEVAAQVFREDFRQLSTDDRKMIGDYGVMADYASRVFAVRRGFETDLKNLAAEGVKIYTECGLSTDDFLSKSRGGVGESLRRFAQGDTRRPNSTWVKAAAEGKFFPGTARPAVVSAFGDASRRGLDDVVKKILDLFDRRYGVYVSALAQVRTIHVIGILGAISERVREQAHEQNIFLLSDSGELISKLIADDDTPFIYEKIGAAYDHYIIDEFQDTSRIQWNNFRPLIAETLSRGQDNLVVGDVKQSIYRWRNSDWRIIHSEAAQVFGDAVETVHLSTNYRSRANVIRFNNALFSPASIPASCDERLAYEGLKISDVYSDSEQQGTPGKPGGYVSVTLYRKNDDEGWKDRVLRDLPGVIERLQEHGYRADDILFLCRTNEEGKSIISRILEYSSLCTPGQRARYNYEITSGESLLLERNPAVTLMTASLRYLTDPASRINRSQIVRSYILATGGMNGLYSGDTPDGGGESLPEGWEEAIESFRNASLYSATEGMIRFFGLGRNRANTAYISSFQDVVLAWSGRHSSDISAFVQWWDDEGCKSTLSQSERQEAMRVMTVHKAKGLQSRESSFPLLHGSSQAGTPDLCCGHHARSFAPMPCFGNVSRLDESLSREAKMERASDWLDSVNLLYVAFTGPWMHSVMTRVTGPAGGSGAIPPAF